MPGIIIWPHEPDNFYTIVLEVIYTHHPDFTSLLEEWYINVMFFIYEKTSNAAKRHFMHAQNDNRLGTAS